MFIQLSHVSVEAERDSKRQKRTGKELVGDSEYSHSRESKPKDLDMKSRESVRSMETIDGETELLESLVQAAHVRLHVFLSLSYCMNWVYGYKVGHEQCCSCLVLLLINLALGTLWSLPL